MYEDAYQKECRYYRPWMLSAVCGVAIVIYGSILRFLATCGCVQGRDFFKLNWVGKNCKEFVEFFGGVMIVILLSKYQIKSLHEIFQAIFLYFIYNHPILSSSFNSYFAVVSCVLLSWAIYYSYESNTGYGVFINMLISKAWSLLDWFFYTLPYFSLRYQRDKRIFYRDQSFNETEPLNGNGTTATEESSIEAPSAKNIPQ